MVVVVVFFSLRTARLERHRCSPFSQWRDILELMTQFASNMLPMVMVWECCLLPCDTDGRQHPFLLSTHFYPLHYMGSPVLKEPSFERSNKWNCMMLFPFVFSWEEFTRQQVCKVFFTAPGFWLILFPLSHLLNMHTFSFLELLYSYLLFFYPHATTLTL